MSEDFSIQDYIDNNLCIAYGAVIYGDPNQNWTSYWNEEKQLFELRKKNPDLPDSPESHKLFLSKGINYPELAKFVHGYPQNTILGHLTSTYLGQSLNYNRNYQSSSGGVIKETLRYLFHTQQITSVITVQKTGKLLYEPVKITDVGEIDNLPPSIYHTIDTTKTIDLLENCATNEKVVIIGTPWQIDDLYIYIKYVHPELKNVIFLTIGLLTGWYFNQHNIKALCHYYNINYDNLDDIRYRGYGKKGMIRFYDKEHRLIREAPRFNIYSQSTSEIYYNLPMYNLYPNTHNMLADIVVGDPHLGECGFSKTGINLVLTRNAYAQNIINNMSQQRYIHAVKIQDNALERSQKRLRLYGDFAYPYAHYLKEHGFPYPTFYTYSKEHIQPVSQQYIAKFVQKDMQRKQLQQNNAYDKILKKHIFDIRLASIKKFTSLSYFQYRVKTYIRKRQKPDFHLKEFQ